MALKLRFDDQAKRDLVGIRTYLIAHANEVLAERVRAHLRTRFKRLCQNPNIGVLSANPRIRVLAPARYPYRIYYGVVGDALVVLHVRYTACRDPDLNDLR